MNEISRREILKKSAVAMVAAPGVLPVLGQNNRLRVGWIATGARGQHVMKQMYLSSKDLVNVVALCDTFQGNLAKGKDIVQTEEKTTPKTYIDYRDVLSDPNVDVVFIASPEHLHYPMAIAALKANKHIYLEKPIGHTIEEGADIVRLSEKTNRVVQVGTQNRSNKLYIHAKKRYFQWRNYWDYSGGISTDLLVHQTDISNFVVNKTVPNSCMASGGIYQWTKGGFKDDREVPDTLSALYEYPDRFHLNYSCFFGNDQYGYGEQFMGQKGTIEVLDRQNL